MGWIIVILVIWVMWIGIKATFKDAYTEVKDAHYSHTINKSDVKKELFLERVRELNLNLDKAIYVLYCDGDDNGGIYKYLWYEDGALALFNSVETVGTWKLSTSPKEWKVLYIEKNNIEGIYRRSNYCQLNFTDGSNAKFSLNDYNAIKKLLTDNGLIQ